MTHTLDMRQDLSSVTTSYIISEEEIFLKIYKNSLQNLCTYAKKTKQLQSEDTCKILNTVEMTQDLSLLANHDPFHPSQELALIPVIRNTLQHILMHCNILQYILIYCNTFEHVLMHFN